MFFASLSLLRLRIGFTSPRNTFSFLKAFYDTGLLDRVLEEVKSMEECVNDINYKWVIN